jgi:hypothetical protein
MSDHWSYPATICPARYSGIYEGGMWVAFNLHAEALPDGWDGGDIDAAEYWGSDQSLLVGRGSTPDAAHDDMSRRLRGQ